MSWNDPFYSFQNKMNGLSLFTGAGISETFLKDTVVDIKVANELVPNRARLYSHFYPKCKMICGDITDKTVQQQVVSEAKKHNVDFLMATPPCQSMSRAGRMRVDDERTLLFIPVLNLIEELKPKYVLIENVPEFLKSFYEKDNNRVDVMQEIRGRCWEYHIEEKVLDAADFETPQTRKRAIVLMSRKSLPVWKHPAPLGFRITVEEAIGHLPRLESGQSSGIKYHNAKTHNNRHILWMSHTPTGQSAFQNEIHFPEKNGRKIKGFGSTYKRIRWDKPAPTITMTNGSISSQNNVHPGRFMEDSGLWSDARVLSLLEIILLTGLPPDWDIPEWATDTLVRHVIGEGVPPKLVYHIVKQLEK